MIKVAKVKRNKNVAIKSELLETVMEWSRDYLNADYFHFIINLLLIMF